MRRNLLLLFTFILFFISYSLFASKIPAMIVEPFSQEVTIGKNTTTNVDIVVQNNTGVNLTITDIVPKIPTNSSVTATIINNQCGVLAPQDSCEALAELQGLTQPGHENLNVSVCAFNGTLCSRIEQPLTIINAPLIAVFVSPTNPSIESGTTEQFNATGLYADNTIQDITNSVTWNSSNSAKATISSEGLASGITTGTSTISATQNGLSDSTTLTIKPATLSSITVIPVQSSIAKGTTQQFNAVGIYSDNSFQNLTSLVSWNSSNQSIATISRTGLSTGKNVGSTTITALMNSISGTATLTVASTTLNSISVTPSHPTSEKGEKQQFTATGIYSDNSIRNLTNEVTWNTGSALIAIISNQSSSKGVALARNTGTTSVKATLGSVSGSTNFTVNAAVLNSIFVSPTNQTILAGETQQYTATGIFSDFRTQDLTTTATWKSSKTSIATISNAASSKGLATTLSAGTATISATQEGITGNTSIIVNTAQLVSIAITPNTPTIANGEEQQFNATGTYSDGTTRDLTNVVTWISGTPAVAVISNVNGSHGLATSVTTGSTTISAVFEGVTANTTLTVSAATLTSIAITPANTSIPVDTTVQLTATGTFSDLSTEKITNQVTWLSSDISKATVSNAAETKGLVTGISQGSTTISAIQHNVTGSTTLTVTTVNIGESLQGGKVACLDGGLENLITANSNNSTGIIWGGTGTTTNAQNLIDGQANTTRIVTALGAGTTYAAGLCDAYEIDSAGNTPCVGGNTCYNDWFLPSTDQIACIRDNKNKIDGFLKENYWSSTEDASASSTQAWYITFANSGQSPATTSKTNVYAVRCVRLINAIP